MSLGSIAHLQYYFARTGLLDGKGGQIAKPRQQAGSHSQSVPGTRNAFPAVRSASQPVSRRELSSLGVGLVDSPVEEQDWDGEDQEQMMLPPTVSTYSHRVQHVPPPPDAEALRKDLRHALEQARQALVEIQDQQVSSVDWWGENKDVLVHADQKTRSASSESPPSQGLHELQGIHLLDIVTLAIRSARIYYTAHDHPERLTSIKSERKIREELFTVLDVLKRMASRNFAGGLKGEERTAIDNWIVQVEELLVQEQEKERLEQRERERWPWLKGDWSGREHEREWLFIKSFITEVDLPAWAPPTQAESLPTPFLSAFQNGLLLVRLHNVLVEKSKKHFGEIKTFHTDTAKPYRCAENLRYWAKAAEIRWETKLNIDVTGIVHGQSDGVWKNFDIAILTWCKAVRADLTREWTEAASKEATSHDTAWIPPQLRFEMDEPSLAS